MYMKCTCKYPGSSTVTQLNVHDSIWFLSIINCANRYLRPCVYSELRHAVDTLAVPDLRKAWDYNHLKLSVAQELKFSFGGFRMLALIQRPCAAQDTLQAPKKEQVSLLMFFSSSYYLNGVYATMIFVNVISSSYYMLLSKWTWLLLSWMFTSQGFDNRRFDIANTCCVHYVSHQRISAI